jgi:hypothetical protein
MALEMVGRTGFHLEKKMSEVRLVFAIQTKRLREWSLEEALYDVHQDFGY